MDGSWQTVGGKKKDKQAEKKRKTNEAEPLKQSADGAPSAFAALDAWKRDDGSQQRSAQAQGGHASNGGAPYANGVTGLNGLDHTTDDGGSDASQQSPAKQKNKKQKAPKVRKPTPASAAAQLKLDAVAQIIRSAEERYGGDERVQLDLVADHFVSVFRDAELPFNKLLAEQPLPKVTNTPVDAVPEDVVEAVSDFLSGKDAAAVATFAQALMDAAFDAVPEAAGSSKAPPKANVGLLVALALALRAKPAALLLTAGALAVGGRRYTSSGRLPLLLWLLEQAAQGSEAVAVAVWIRVLLPQILGPAGAVAVASPAAAAPGKAAAAAASASPPEPPPLSLAAATRAFKYLDGLLGTPAVKRDMHAGVAARDGEPPAPLVPPASLIALQQAVHGADGLQGEVAVLARSHEGILRTIGVRGVPDGGFDACELLRLALEAAATGSGAPDDPLAASCAELVIEALLADDAAFTMWQTRHKGQLRGSSRVLTALEAAYPGPCMPLLSEPAKRAAFLALMPALRGRHQYALRSGKGWQGSCARAADGAAHTLAAKLKRDGGKTAMRSALVTVAGGLGISMALAALTSGSVMEHPLLKAAAAGATAVGLTGVLQQAAARLEPYRQQAVDVAWPHVQPAVQAAAPYVQQVSAAVQPVVQKVSDAASHASEYALSALANATASFR